MNSASLAAQLADTFLFRDLNPEQLETLLRGTEVRDYAEGQTVFREGDDARELLFLVTGEVEIRKRVNEGTDTRLAILRAPTAFGEIAFLVSGRRNATALARGEVTVLVLTRYEFEKVIRSEPVVAARFLHNLSRLLAGRLHQADDAILAP